MLVPPGKRGIILYTVRDAITRDPASTTSPTGFRRVLEALSAIGYRQVEFAGYRQHANAEGGASLDSVEGARLLRGWLDAYGLRAQGNHGFIPGSWPLTTADLDRFKLALEIANILGLEHMGTGSDPTGSAYKADWDVAADKWNALGAIARDAGIKLYTHNHDAAYAFLLDSGPPDEQGRRRARPASASSSTSSGSATPGSCTSRWTSTGRTSRSTSTGPTPRPTARRAPTSSTRCAPSGPRRSASPLPRQGRRVEPGRPQRLRHGAVRHRRHRLPAVLLPPAPPRLPQPDVRAGQRPGADPAQSLQLAELSYRNMAALRG
ncbi:TIM barrel protein [Nonomuraea thailandensis]